jgi:hypothetical protein
MRNLSVKARKGWALMEERRLQRNGIGQHIILAGEQHITELCNVEDVTVHAEVLSDEHPNT